MFQISSYKVYVLQFVFVCVCVCVFVCGLCCQACGALVLWPGIKLGPLAVRVQSPNQWTTREFPQIVFFMYVLWFQKHKWQ